MVTKEHILNEIRRTAALNGGKALGTHRFFAETGVKDSDWRGRYWVRWSDAVAEAGCSPNSFNKPIPDHELLDALAVLLQELGHFPLHAEIALKSRADPSFPHVNTIKRLGRKHELAAMLRDRLLARGDIELAAQCDEAVASHEPQDESTTPPEESTFGFVYLMKSGRFYKIGRTNALGRRERELAIQLPEPVRTIHSIKTDDPEGIEHYWHQRFRDRKKNGEWFELSPADVAAFQRRRFM